MIQLVFYNGFNLLVDIIVAVITAVVVARIAYWQGFSDAIDTTEDAEQYAWEQQRESE